MAEPQRTANPKAAVVAADADAALQFIDNHETPPMTAEDERRLIRKIDFSIVPLMFTCYVIQYLDKSLVNYANIMGLQRDTHISGNQFSQLALVFYVTYLALEFPTGFLMQIFPTAKYLGANVICWGLAVACTATGNSWAILVSLRVLLGCFEAVVTPALILITSMWYKTAEQPRRVGVWYLGTGIAKILGAVTSFGFQHYNGDKFKSWQIMFLICGLITIAICILIVVLMPDNPMTCRMSDLEKKWAISRLRTNKTGIENKHFKMYQVVECFKDPQTWILSLALICCTIPNGFISSYQATVIKGFGFTSKVTSLMSIPSGVIDCIGTVIGCFLAGKYNMRGPFIILFFAIGFTGSCLMAFLPIKGHVAGKMVGNYFTSLISSAAPLLYSYSAANYAGHTKKITMNAIILISYCIGNIIGPLTFQQRDKPEYIPAKIVMVVASAGAALSTAALMLYYNVENRRRDLVHAQKEHVGNSEFFNLTDRENHEFRYSL